ncbi:MAG: 6-phosphofructokinase [Planctomycetota bacterium]
MEHPTLGILVGGGPAPGINGVIAAATIEARNRGWKVLGFLDGLKWVSEGTLSRVVELGIRDVSRIHLTGGSILRTSRAGHMQDPEVLATVLGSFESLGIDALITIGGDGTAGAASTIYEASSGDLSVVHVPKTIDNDIPLPGGFSTFGYQTARHVGVEVVQSLMEDAKTTGRWFIVVTMGRQAGHLALGIGKAAGATLTLIPEEFPEVRISLDDLLLPIEGSMIRRRAAGRDDGVVVLAEGIAEKLDPDELARDEDIELDPHGKVHLSDLPLGRLLRNRLVRTFKERGIRMNIMHKVIGYELRCAAPIPFDAEYTRDLGCGAMEAVFRGDRSGIVCRYQGKIRVHPFEEFKDPKTGRTRVRFVDTSSESYQVSARYQLRMRPTDLEDDEEAERLARCAGISSDALRERFLVCMLHGR